MVPELGTLYKNSATSDNTSDKNLEEQVTSATQKKDTGLNIHPRIGELCRRTTVMIIMDI